jgi:hypothetical protein
MKKPFPVTVPEERTEYVCQRSTAMLRELEIRGITYMSSKMTVAQVAAGLLVQGLVGNSSKKRTHIVAIEWQAVPRATNETQLHPGNGVEHSEELFVAIVVNNDVGEQRDSYCR